MSSKSELEIRVNSILEKISRKISDKRQAEFYNSVKSKIYGSSGDAQESLPRAPIDVQEVMKGIKERAARDRTNAEYELIKSETLRNQETFNSRILDYMREVTTVLKKLDNDLASLIRPSISDLSYVRFENKYRGSYEEVLNKFRQYLRFFVGQSDTVVDLGCGRGEFLELLHTSGIPAYGVDSNPAMIKACSNRGLRVVEGDMISHLRSLQDDSLGGIFTAQTIEHLPPGEQIELLKLAFSKLKLGKFLVIETPNPKSLAVYTHSFYVDITHIRPVHPETLSFILSELGFKKVEFIYSSEFPEEARLAKISLDRESDGLMVLNRNIEKLNDLLWGHQDYAAIATK